MSKKTTVSTVEKSTEKVELTETQTLQIALDKANEIIAEQKDKLSTAKIVKANSEFFVNKENALMIYKNLSETKFFFESKEEETLKNLLIVCEKSVFTSKQFHTALKVCVDEFVVNRLKSE